MSQWEKGTGRLILPWKESDFHEAEIDLTSQQVLEFTLTAKAEIELALSSLRQSVLVFSLRRSPPNLAPMVYVDLQELCEQKPEAILSLDTEEVGCP